MANIYRQGFHPVDSARFKPRIFSVASGYAPTNSCLGIAKYDVVTLVTAGNIELVDAGAADSRKILGVVASVRFANTDGSPNYGGYLPSGYTFSGNANVSNPLAPIIEVWVDPDIEYWACVVTGTTNALAYAGVGANMDMSVTSATTVGTVYRESLRTLDAAFITSTAQFRITDVIRDPINDVTAAMYRVKCQINEGFASVLDTGGI